MTVHRADHARFPLALTRLGPFSIAIEAERITGFLEPGQEEADCDLAAMVGVAMPDAASGRQLELTSAGRRLVVTIRGPLRMADSEERVPWHCPALIAGALRRACVRGVIQHESTLVFLLDVDELAARVGHARKETSCESD
jgi:hypothetical protein